MAKPVTPNAVLVYPAGTSTMPAAVPCGPIAASAGLTVPRSAPRDWVASARMPANVGEACEVPSLASIEMSGSARPVTPLRAGMPCCHDGCG